MHRQERRNYCSVCRVLGSNREKIKIKTRCFVWLCNSCKEHVTLATISNMEHDKQQTKRVDVWECDLCDRRVEESYPPEWRGIFFGRPDRKNDENVVELDVCGDCVLTKALRDLPFLLSPTLQEGHNGSESLQPPAEEG